MTSDAVQALSDFPALELLAAVAPFARQKPVRGAPAALFSREIPVYGFKQWIPQLRVFAERNAVQFGAFGLSKPSLISNSGEFVIAADVTFAGATSSATFPFWHSDYTRSLCSGDWAQLVSGVEVKLPMTVLPTQSVFTMPDCDLTDGGEIVVSFRKPIEYRIARGRLIRRLTTMQLHSLVIDDNGARPVFTGVPSWIVEPRLVWAEAAPQVRTLITERPTRERRAFKEYLAQCGERRIAPTARGAERYMREQLCRGPLAWFAWMGIRAIVWAIIREFFAEGTAGQTA